MRGGSDGISVPGPESYEGAGCKSLKGPIALAIDVLFLFFHNLLLVILTIFSLFRKIIM